MIYNLSESNSFINQILFELRDEGIQIDRSKFRRNMEKLGGLMAYELSKSLTYSDWEFETPLARMKLPLPKLPAVIGIMRAAVPFMEGLISVFDNVDVGFIGAYRKHDSPDIQIDLNYAAIPEVDGEEVALVDPMLATGKSFVKTVNELSTFGTPSHIHLVCAIATPEGIDYISSHLKNYKYTIWAASIDSHLDKNSYIVPGLGDAGDLSFGQKIAR